MPEASGVRLVGVSSDIVVYIIYLIGRNAGLDSNNLSGPYPRWLRGL